jgi:tRNA threonylcarbamoyladenosine biosynthesis protein TsaE
MTLYQSHSPEETARLGKQFAVSLRNGNVVALTGDLGTGKTHFIEGVCEGLGVRGHVASPTFTIINEYPSEGCTVVHVDLYRIGSSRELLELGVEEYFGDRFICLIEWAERMVEYLPQSYIQVRLAYGEQDNDRLIEIDHVHAAAQRVSGVVA